MSTRSPRPTEASRKDSRPEDGERASVRYQPLDTSPEAEKDPPSAPSSAPAPKVGWRDALRAALRCEGRRRWCCYASILVSCALLVHRLRPITPSWTVDEVAIVDLDIPSLMGRTLVPANTSACPQYDPCGEQQEQSCSHCPRDGDWTKTGCLCRLRPSGGFFDDVENVANYVEHLDDGAMITMKLQSNVTLYNPNLVGASTQNGTFQVFYKDKLLGDGDVKPLTVPPLGSTKVGVDIAIKGVSVIVGMEMMQELVRSGWKLRVDVHGTVVIFVGQVEVDASSQCAMTSDVSDYMETRERLFSKRDCLYKYVYHSDDLWSMLR